jgi:Mg2+ and Co2+ transporter CorA
MAVIDNAVYVNGRRTTDPETLDETFEVLRDRKGLAWIGLYRPDENEIRTVAAEFELHELPVQDAISAHQRPKMERYGDTLFVMVLPAKFDVDIEMRCNLRDMADHAERLVKRGGDAFPDLLQNASTVKATLVGQQQNRGDPVRDRGRPGAER